LIVFFVMDGADGWFRSKDGTIGKSAVTGGGSGIGASVIVSLVTSFIIQSIIGDGAGSWFYLGIDFREHESLFG